MGFEGFRSDLGFFLQDCLHPVNPAARIVTDLWQPVARRLGTRETATSEMLLALHKPYGMLSQFTPDRDGQLTLASCGFPPEVYPLGRLDLDSEGLLLLSDEPGLNTRLLDPRNAHPRTYHAQVEGAIQEDALNRLRRGGLVIDGHRSLPCSARQISPAHPDRDPPIRHRVSIPTSWIELTLIEGKNRQVRRMTAAVGFPTLRLIRVAILDLTLAGSGLAPGQWRELSDKERGLLSPVNDTGLPASSRKPGKHFRKGKGKR